MSWTLSSEGLNALLSALQEAQLGLRALLHAVGLAPDIDGQPAWPFTQRLAGEMLAFDAGHARRVAVSVACLLAAVLALTVSALWRRASRWLCGGAVALLVLAPWPQAHLLLAPAVPTSFHQSPTGFTAQAIARGQGVYQQHCLRCHGVDGRGEGLDAASLPMWPPTLNGSLLWQRLDGELFWHVGRGMAGRDGRLTMPGFTRQLTDVQIWEVLDFLQAQAAGRMLQASGAWAYPVRMPDAAVQCRQAHRRTVRSLAGQRLRVAVTGRDTNAPADDPRLVTVQLSLSRTAQAPPDAECRMAGAESVTALSLVLGVPTAQLESYQLVVDRGGWLRARGKPGQAAWSEDDLICRSTAAPAARAAAQPAGDGLDGLIRRMDAEPVKLLRGGFPH